MLLALGERIGETPPPPDQAAVWLHAEAIPRGLVSFEEAAALGRSLALAASPRVPGELVAAVLDDAREMVGRDEDGTLRPATAEPGLAR
jgi:hypothetical protein